MQPFDFSIKQPDPNQMIMGGLQNASAIMQVQNAQRESEAKVQLAQQQTADLQAKQIEAQRRQQRFAQVAQNPTSSAVRRLMVEFPELSEQFKRSVDSLSASEKETMIRTGSGALFALEKGKQDIALSLIDRDIEAARNSGDDGMVFNLENIKDSIIASPDGARFALKGVLMSAMGGKEFADTMKGLGEEERAQAEAPARLTKIQAEAEKAAVDARFAESDAVIDLEKKGWDIKKIQSDMQIAKMNSQIAAMNAQTSRMSAGLAAQGNSLKQQENELKMQEMLDKRDEAVRVKAFELEQARTTTDDMLNTIARIKKNPALSRVVGVLGGRINTAPLSNDALDAIALLESFGSEAFLAQREKLKGGGSITDFEGQKGADALANVTRKQSLKQLMENLDEAERRLLKGRKQLADKFGVPDSIPDTPAAIPSGNEIDALLRKYGQ